MPNQPDIIYEIDQDDRLIAFNSEWNRFAENNGEHLLSSDVIYQASIWDFVCDPETRHIHKILLKKVRTSQAPLLLNFRCDSPVLRRFMEMEISPLADGHVQYCCRLMHAQARGFVDLSGSLKDQEFLRMCSWCKRIAAGAQWLEVEDAVNVLKLFSAAQLPPITHTICERCFAELAEE